MPEEIKNTERKEKKKKTSPGREETRSRKKNARTVCIGNMLWYYRKGMRKKE
jgi:hypothetical protein